MFYFSFALVAVSSLIHSVDIVFRLFESQSPFNSTNYEYLMETFGNPFALLKRSIRMPIYIYNFFGGLTLLLMLRRCYLIATSKPDKVPNTYSSLLYGMVSLSIKGSIISFAMMAIGSLGSIFFGVLGILGFTLLPHLLTPSIVLIEISSFWASNQP
jgi:hypothetical protein